LGKTRVFVALDFATAEEAFGMVEKLLPINPCFKVGLELFVAEGPDFVRQLSAKGAEIFLDLKFHDIPNTVAGAVRSAVNLGVSCLNVHCGGGKEMLVSARRACDEAAAKKGGEAPKLYGVTVLTSLDDNAVQEIGFPRSASAQVKHFVDLALDAKLDGVVCSPLELALVRKLAGPDFLTMVPGIRPAGAAAGDQKRTLGPVEAVEAGASCLVIGRPITGAADPADALRKVLSSLRGGSFA
jgi:orotidine-5'-phosphate decarboxylase